MTGFLPSNAVIHVVRHHSAAELEAKARARAQRAEERKRHEAERREHKEREEREKQERESGPSPGTCPNGTYENSSGNIVCKPYATTNGEQPAGATAECEDGTYSFSEHRSGTCSSHGGVKRWLNE
jgi:sRNA-binding protein